MCVIDSPSESFGEDDDSLHQSAIGTLLQRSRASRSRKPMSIRAMMEQASTYSNLSRAASAKSPTPSNNGHAIAHQSATSSRSSKSESPSSSIVSSYGRAVSPPTTDGYDSAVSGKVTKHPRAKSARKKRPAYLALQLEEPEDSPENGFRPSRKEKDYLRRSSPTVAEHFKFTPGAPPPPQPSENDLILASVAASANGYEYPLPIRERPESSTLDVIEQTIDELTQEISGTSSLPTAELEEGDYVDDGEQHELRNQNSSSSVQSQVITLPQTARLRKHASHDKLSTQRGGKPQPPPSSQLQTVQINHMDQNETQFGQSSQQPPPQTGPPPKVPPPPIPQHQQTRVQETAPVHHIQYAAHPSRHVYAQHSESLHQHQHPPRAQSLVRQAQERGAIDQTHHERSQHLNGNHSSTTPALKQRRLQRPGSDAGQRQHGFTRFPMPPQPEEEDESGSPDESLISTTMPLHSESWPLSPETVPIALPEPRQRIDQEQNGDENGLTLPQAEAHPESQLHSRNMSQTSYASQTTSRSYDLINTPRQSRSGTPSYGTATIYTSTPRTVRSSGTGTIATVRSDESGSTAGSGLSAQWYRPPRERTGLGPRVSHAEPVPWELGAEAGELERLQEEPKRPMFTVFPPQDPSRQREGRAAHDRPRSPLMDEKFPISIKDMQGNRIVKAPISETDSATQKSSSSERSRAGASTPAKELLDLGGGKKPKKAKNSLLKEMISEYRNMSSKWYMEPYRELEVRELDWQKERSQSSAGTRPSTAGSSAIMNSHGPPPSIDLEPVKEQPYEGESALQSPITSATSSSAYNNGILVERGLHQEVTNLKPPMAPPLPKSSDNQSAKTGMPRPSGETAGSDQSSSRGSRMSLDGKVMEKKKKEKKMKKPSLLGEILKEYKEMTNTWYASPYQDRPTARSGSTSTGRS